MTSRAFAIAACLVVTLPLGASACAGEQTEATQPAAPQPPPPAPAAPAPVASAATPGAPGPGQWVTWSHEQKLGYMKSDVMPKMGAAFTAYDPAKYAAPKCNLCHVAGVKDHTFKMPDAELPKLPSNPADFKAIAAKDPKILDFMSKTVVPQTAALLGEPAFDMTTKTGFGCFGCHTKQ